MKTTRNMKISIKILTPTKEHQNNLMHLKIEKCQQKNNQLLAILHKNKKINFKLLFSLNKIGCQSNKMLLKTNMLNSKI